MTNIPRKTYAFSIMVAHQSTKKELVYANELYISTRRLMGSTNQADPSCF